MSTCIEVSNLTKLFRGRTVVDGLSFCVQGGEEAVSMGVELDSIWKIVVLLVGITLLCTVISVKTFRWE